MGRRALYLTPEDGAKDGCVRPTGIQGQDLKSLAEGDRAELDVVESQKGPAALNVVKIS